MKLYSTATLASSYNGSKLASGYVLAENKDEAMGLLYKQSKDKYPGMEINILVAEIDENTLRKVVESMNVKKETS